MQQLRPRRLRPRRRGPLPRRPHAAGRRRGGRGQRRRRRAGLQTRPASAGRVSRGGDPSGSKRAGRRPERGGEARCPTPAARRKFCRPRDAPVPAAVPRRPRPVRALDGLPQLRDLRGDPVPRAWPAPRGGRVGHGGHAGVHAGGGGRGGGGDGAERAGVSCADARRRHGGARAVGEALHGGEWGRMSTCDSSCGNRRAAQLGRGRDVGHRCGNPRGDCGGDRTPSGVPPGLHPGRRPRPGPRRVGCRPRRRRFSPAAHPGPLPGEPHAVPPAPRRRRRRRDHLHRRHVRLFDP
mmetsp:Transcript_18659/g.46847  ORF Transcript_18659/g.46847 Transcript_18659/m.46847 type:complete len:294 (-) Transcript_18659:508-1389(-)